MNIYETKIVCKTFQGLEQVLADELKELNAKNIEIIKRAVVCDYDLEILYRCNLQLRTCLKVLVPVFEFESNSPDDLYKALDEGLLWNFIGKNDGLAMKNILVGDYTINYFE